MASVRQSTTVIVAVVIVKDGALLMVQEAKPECRGKYYLPAGRMEAGETIQQAAIRECKEEAGFDIEPTGIFSVEFNPQGPSHVWQRYGITANIIGGTIKTTEDKESLKAEWVPLTNLGTDKVQLRALDVIFLVEAWKANRKTAIPFGLPRPKGDGAF